MALTSPSTEIAKNMLGIQRFARGYLTICDVIAGLVRTYISKTLLMQTGDGTSVRFYFAKIGVNECNRDFSPTTRKSCYKVRSNL
jgi:hypothetical protein